MSTLPFAAPKDRAVLCSTIRGILRLDGEWPCLAWACFFHSWMFMCFVALTPSVPVTGSLPSIHRACRFALSKNHLRTVELRNRERATDVSLGFLHSNWITQAGAHRQQGCTPWLLEGHSKNSFQCIKKDQDPMERARAEMCMQANGHRNMHSFVGKGVDQSTLNTVKHTQLWSAGWCMQRAFLLS